MEVEALVEEDCVETDTHQEPDSGGYLEEERVQTETAQEAELGSASLQHRELRNRRARERRAALTPEQRQLAKDARKGREHRARERRAALMPQQQELEERVHPETQKAVVDSDTHNVRPNLLLHPMLLSCYLDQLTLRHVTFSWMTVRLLWK